MKILALASSILLLSAAVLTGCGQNNSANQGANTQGTGTATNLSTGYNGNTGATRTGGTGAGTFDNRTNYGTGTGTAGTDMRTGRAGMYGTSTWQGAVFRQGAPLSMNLAAGSLQSAVRSVSGMSRATVMTSGSSAYVFVDGDIGPAAGTATSQSSGTDTGGKLGTTGKIGMTSGARTSGGASTAGGAGTSGRAGKTGGKTGGAGTSSTKASALSPASKKQVNAAIQRVNPAITQVFFVIR